MMFNKAAPKQKIDRNSQRLNILDVWNISKYIRRIECTLIDFPFFFCRLRKLRSINMQSIAIYGQLLQVEKKR